MWINNHKAISTMFQKQTIHIKSDPIDRDTIMMLKKSNRYKLFKFEINLCSTKIARLKIFTEMIEEMPDLEISEITLWESNNEVVNLLAEKTMFETKQDLFNVLRSFSWTVAKQSEPHEYISWVSTPEIESMSQFVKQTKVLDIMELDRDICIDFIADQVKLSSSCLQKFGKHLSGTQIFFDSVNSVSISFDCKNEINVYNCLDLVNMHFKNLKYYKLIGIKNLSMTEFADILNN